MQGKIAIRLLAATCFLLATISVGAETSKNPRLKPLTVPFDVTLESLPPYFYGHNYLDLIKAINKNPRPKKSEFETKAEYSIRLANWRSSVLYGEVTLGSRIAIGNWFKTTEQRTVGMKTVYDAESQTMKVFFAPQCEGRPGLELLSTSKKLGTYVGQNAFGVRRNVVKYERTTICLELAERDNLPISFPVQRHVAQITDLTLNYLIVGTLRDNPLEIEPPSYQMPTIDLPTESAHTVIRLKMSPSQLWLFEPDTGKVFHRELFFSVD